MIAENHDTSSGSRSREGFVSSPAAALSAPVQTSLASFLWEPTGYVMHFEMVALSGSEWLPWSSRRTFDESLFPGFRVSRFYS